MMMPASSATGMKSSGRMRPTPGRSQRMSASRLATRPVVEIDDGLVVGEQLVAGGRLAQRRLERRAGGRVPLHRACRTPRRACCRRSLARYIAVSAKRRSSSGVSVPVLTDTPIDAPTNTSLPATMNAPVSASTIRAATALIGVEVGRARAEHDELVAAEPGDDVLHADRARDPVGDEHEELVAGVVAEPVVDELEPVEVDEHHPDDVVGAARVARSRPARGRAACGDWAVR